MSRVTTCIECERRTTTTSKTPGYRPRCITCRGKKPWSAPERKCPCGVTFAPRGVNATHCPPCSKAARAAKALRKYHRDPEKAKAATQAWAKANPEKKKASRDAWYRKARPAPYVPELRRCAQCDEVFKTTSDGHLYCSEACSTKAARVRSAERRPSKRCAHCGASVPASTVGKNPVCSPKCRKARQREKLRQRNHARWARRKGVEAERIDFSYVCERDKWRCQLCGKRVNPDTAWPHPMAATIDHIIPQTLGGNHTYANVQLAHSRCNTSKGNRATRPEQLRLIG